MVSFGFSACTTLSELITLTYYQDDDIYECQIQGNGNGETEYTCNSDQALTRQCVSTGGTKYGLQISIPKDKSRDVDDICVDRLWVNGNFVYVGGDTFMNYVYFDLGTGSIYLPSEATGTTVPGLPRCM